MPMIESKRVVELVDDCRTDPIKFFKIQWPTEKIWPGQQRIADSITKNKRTYVKACHSSSKTHTAARLAIWWMKMFRPSLVITTATTYLQVQMQLWGQIRTAHRTAQYNIGGVVLPSSPLWKISDEHYAIGLSVKEPERIQGHHTPSGYVLVILDEGSGVPDNIYDAIEGLLTSENSKLLVIGNPLRNVGKFASYFKTGTIGRITLSGLEAVKYHDEINGLISQQYIDEQHAEYLAGRNPMYLPRVLGEEPEITINQIFSALDIDWAMTNLVRENYDDYPIHVSIDWAMGGENKNVFGAWQGPKRIEKESFNYLSPTETIGRAIIFINKHKAKYVGHDNCGGGKIYGDLLKKALPRETKVIDIDSSGEATNSAFGNLRAEMAYNARDMLHERKVQLEFDDEIKQQLLLYTSFADKYGRLFVASKKDIIADYGVSPDDADEVIYGLHTLKYVQKREVKEEREEHGRERPVHSNSYLSA